MKTGQFSGVLFSQYSVYRCHDIFRLDPLFFVFENSSGYRMVSRYTAKRFIPADRFGPGNSPCEPQPANTRAHLRDENFKAGKCMPVPFDGLFDAAIRIQLKRTIDPRDL